MKRRSLLLVMIVIAVQCYSQSRKRSHLSITPGADFATMKVTDGNGTQVNFPAETNLRVGMEFEFPIRDGRWAIILEPTFQRYTAHRPTVLLYRSLETPLGVRRYFKVNKNAGVFVNGAVVGDIPFTYVMELAPGFNVRSPKFKTNFIAGAGVAITRFTIEYRLYTQRTGKDDTDSFTFNYNKRSIIIGYRLY